MHAMTVIVPLTPRRALSDHIDAYLRTLGTAERVEYDDWHRLPEPTGTFQIPGARRTIRLTARPVTPGVSQVTGAVGEGWGSEWQECEGTKDERRFLAGLLRSFREVPRKPHPEKRERLALASAYRAEGLGWTEIGERLNMNPDTVRVMVKRADSGK